MGQHPESTHKNQHYASFPGFLAKKQEFQSLQCKGQKMTWVWGSGCWRGPWDATRSERRTANEHEHEHEDEHEDEHEHDDEDEDEEDCVRTPNPNPRRGFTTEAQRTRRGGRNEGWW